MLITKDVEIKLHNTMIKHYESLGYKIPRVFDKRKRLVVPKGTILKVKVEHLTNDSIVPVECLCDYCLEEGIKKIVTKNWRDYLRGIKIIAKDCCEKCTPKKNKESCLKKYGVENIFQLEEIKQKTIKTCLERYGEVSYTKTKEYDEKSKYTRLERYGVEYTINNLKSREKMIQSMLNLYGVEYYAQSKECKEHTKQTNLKRYGKEYVSQVDEFKNKATKTNLKKFGVKRYAQSQEFKLKFSKEYSPNWKGGITLLSEYLRHKINIWKIDSFKLYDYKCDITGYKNNLIIHHFFNFSDIVLETLKILNFPIYDKVNKYNNEELKQIEEKCLELHYKYGLGVCLSENIHKLFHSIYGKEKNTSEQFEEFKQRYNNGEFNNILKSA